MQGIIVTVDFINVKTLYSSIVLDVLTYESAMLGKQWLSCFR